MNKISKERVNHIANLAKIEIHDNELDYYAKQLTKVMELIQEINELEVDESIQPFVHITHEITQLRNDTVDEQLSIEDVLRNVPSLEGNYIKVPKII